MREITKIFVGLVLAVIILGSGAVCHLVYIYGYIACNLLSQIFMWSWHLVG